MSLITTTATKTVKKYYSPNAVQTELLSGSAVFKLLDDGQFLQAWEQLCNACAWTTVFQSPSFVAAWYKVYRAEFLPVIIKAEYDGQLTALLTLAKGKDGCITGAGANQAEYQVWLTADAQDESFIKNALLQLDRYFPGKKLLLKYIPANVPLGWAQNDTAWRKRCYLKASPHPLMVIDEAHLTGELKKKNRREKMNRLNRLGAVQFERITDYTAFAAIFDELAVQSDFRKGAMYNKAVFAKDPLRKQFLLSLFGQNKLHATVFKIGDKIIAANVSVSGMGRVHLQGLNSFDAVYSKYSPGILHFLLLGKMLATEGVAVFDLTPGADAYKDTLATDHTEAYTLHVGSAFAGFKNRLQARCKKYFKMAAERAGVKQTTLKKLKRNIDLYKVKLRSISGNGVVKLLPGLVPQVKWGSQQVTCWEVNKSDVCISKDLIPVQQDDVKDLLCFDQADVRYSQQQFLAGAMHQFEEGAHCYTWVSGGKLSGCIWFTELNPANLESGYHGITTGWVISFSSMYCHPKARSGFSQFVRSVVAALAMRSPHNLFYITADVKNYDHLQKAGFQLFPLTTSKD